MDWEGGVLGENSVEASEEGVVGSEGRGSVEGLVEEGIDSRGGY